MKKILLLIILLVLLTGCKNVNNESKLYNVYCYKIYDNYEEYISFEYNDNIVTYLNYSYVFNYDITNIIKDINLDDYSDMNIKYNKKYIEFTYKNNIEKYNKLMDVLNEKFNIQNDSYKYIENEKIVYTKLRNSLNDYSCE